MVKSIHGQTLVYIYTPAHRYLYTAYTSKQVHLRAEQMKQMKPSCIGTLNWTSRDKWDPKLRGRHLHDTSRLTVLAPTMALEEILDAVWMKLDGQGRWGPIIHQQDSRDIQRFPMKIDFYFDCWDPHATPPDSKSFDPELPTSPNKGVQLARNCRKTQQDHLP